MSSTKKKPAMSLAIDLGSAFAAIVLYLAGKFRHIESPMDGSQVPTIAYHDPDANKWHFGRDAVMHSYEDSGDNVFMHMKRNFFENTHENLYGGRFSAAEVLTEFLKHLRSLILAAQPELADYPQFGGSKKSEEELAIAFSIPANWGMEPQGEYGSVIQEAGFETFDGFIAEPIAAARHAVRSSNLTLESADKLFVVDVGAGTSDITALEYDRGVFNQLAAASGDAYLAGHDFTAALAERLALPYGIPFVEAYGKGGLNLSNIEGKYRSEVLAIFFAAEEAKKKLSVLEEATVPLELPSGRKTVKVTRAEAAEAWDPQLVRFKQCISESFESSNIDPASIDHPMLVGGSSRLPGLREAMADALGRPVSDIIVCTDSEHIVAAGASEIAYLQDEGSRSLEAGLGFKVFDRASEAYKHLLLIEPGHIIPADGLFLEREGFGIDSTGGVRNLVVEPFACKTGVRAKVVAGRETFLQESETVPLEYVEASLEAFPPADHAVSIGLRLDTGLNPRLLARPTSMPDVEPLSIPLSLAQKNGASEVRVCNGRDVAILLDLSKSMAGEKLSAQTSAVLAFLREAECRGVPVALAAFGGRPGRTDRAREIASFGGYPEEYFDALNSLEAISGTFMAEGLRVTLKQHRDRKNEADHVTVMFTDGMPASVSDAIAAAEELKNFGARLACVGIGHDVDAAFLRGIVSDPDLYRFAEAPADIFLAFTSVAEILWGSSAEDYSDVDSHYDD